MVQTDLDGASCGSVVGDLPSMRIQSVLPILIDSAQYLPTSYFLRIRSVLHNETVAASGFSAREVANLVDFAIPRFQRSFSWSHEFIAAFLDQLDGSRDLSSEPLWLRPVVDRKTPPSEVCPVGPSSLDEQPSRPDLCTTGDNLILVVIAKSQADRSADESDERRFEWLGPWEVLERFLERLVELGRRSDSSRQSRAALTATAREERLVSRACDPPGHVVLELGRPPRAPGISPMEQGALSLASGEMVRAAA
ncbi:hypothetical protein [Saccharothrix hoggarensis]